MKHKLGVAPAYLWISNVFFICSLVILALPLLNFPPLFSPPDWGKTLTMRFVLVVFSFVLLWEVLLGPSRHNTLERIRQKFQQGSRFILFPFAAFFGIFFLSSLLSSDPFFSFWGSPARSGGFINLLSYGMFALGLFLFLREQQWRKLSQFALAIGILVATIAVFQQFGIFRTFLVFSETRPPSTVGGPIFLGIYLLFLIFFALAFTASAQARWANILYGTAAAYLGFVTIFIAQSRAATVGIGIGLLWFLCAYPTQKKLARIIIASAFLAGGIAFFLLKMESAVYSSLPPLVQKATIRILTMREGIQTDQSRLSAWKISWEAIRQKPILGYGTENFAIGFDVAYDPTLPQMARDASRSQISWWDRAHNILLDIGVQGGLFGLATYLALLGGLLVETQRAKKDSRLAPFAHGLQSALLGYVAANLFSFDTFSSYLLFFFCVGYVLQYSARANHAIDTSEVSAQRLQNKEGRQPIKQWIFSGSCIAGAWLLWNFTISPLFANVYINKAQYFAKYGKCDIALDAINRAIDKSPRILAPFSRLIYVDIVSACDEKLGEAKPQIIQKGYLLLKEGAAMYPSYTRNWILLGKFTNGLAMLEKERGNREKVTELLREADLYLGEAHKLSPNRQEVHTEWIQTEIIAERYQEAKKKSEECLSFYQDFGSCWWLKGIAEIYLGEQEQSERDRSRAADLGYNATSRISFSQLVQAYRHRKDSVRLVDTLEKIVESSPNNVNYRVSLAMAYKDIGQFAKARREALKVLELNPALEKDVDAFLLSLP